MRYRHEEGEDEAIGENDDDGTRYDVTKDEDDGEDDGERDEAKKNLI